MRELLPRARPCVEGFTCTVSLNLHTLLRGWFPVLHSTGLQERLCIVTPGLAFPWLPPGLRHTALSPITFKEFRHCCHIFKIGRKFCVHLKKPLEASCVIPVTCCFVTSHARPERLETTAYYYLLVLWADWTQLASSEGHLCHCSWVSPGSAVI